MSGYYLAIDAGTGSGRAVLFDGEGHVVGMGQEEWTHLSEPDVPGSMGFDCAANWPLIARCIRGALAEAGASGSEVRAVSSTSMREGIVLYDEAGCELWACANVDGRAAAQVAALKERDPEAEAAFYRVSGQTFALGAWPRLEWVRQHRPDVFARVARMSMINDWVIARLSGEIVVEPTNAGTSGLMDLSRRDWSDDLIARAGLPQEVFPRVVEPGAALGAVMPGAAEETGLAPGTPVVAGGGDAQLGAVGLGVVREGQAAILAGTFWQQVVNIRSGRTDADMRVRVNPHAPSGLNQAECISFFVGLAMRWFRDAFCDAEKRRAAERGIDAYAVLEEMAAEVPPGSNGIVSIFSDAMDFARWYHAAPSFLNMSVEPGHTTRGSLFRSMQESAAIVSAVNLERVAAFSGVGTMGPIIFAGGASKGQLWTQIVADVLGREVRVPVVREASALGCAMMAMVGAGDVSDLDEASSRVVRFERTIEPDTGKADDYAAARARWEAAYPAQKALVDAGVTEALWRAPGA